MNYTQHDRGFYLTLIIPENINEVQSEDEVDGN